MARVEIDEVVLTNKGDAVPGASVQVNVRGGGAATVYLASTGVATLVNPLTTDGNGRIDGWLEAGSYDLVVTAPTGTYTQAIEAVPGSYFPPSPALNDALIWNGTTWINQKLVNANIDPAAAIDGSKLADSSIFGRKVQFSVGATPPGSPANGDLWQLPADATNGINWLFRYNAGSASAFKWEFVGGPPVLVQVAANQTLPAATGISDLATVGPSFTPTRAGDYVTAWGMQSAPGAPGGGTPFAGAVLCNPTANLGIGEATAPAISAAYTSPAASGRVLGHAAGVELRVRYYNNNINTAAFANRWFSVLPSRVS
jgi:hypothetical protein